MFGEWLGSAMRARSLNNTSLARELGVSTGAVWAWREDRYPPATKHIMQLAEVLGVSAFEVFARITGQPYDHLSDGYLQRALNVLPGDSEVTLRLTGAVLAAVRNEIAMMAREELEALASQAHAVGQSYPAAPSATTREHAAIPHTAAGISHKARRAGPEDRPHPDRSGQTRATRAGDTSEGQTQRGARNRGVAKALEDAVCRAPHATSSKGRQIG